MQRMTKQRRAVMEALALSSNFRSAQQIHKAMVDGGESIGLATVYRNLQILAETEGIDVIRSEDGEALYRQCDEVRHHHHLVCRRCSKSVDIAMADVEAWVNSLGQQHGFTSVEHSFDFFGICAQCAAQGEGADSGVK